MKIFIHASLQKRVDKISTSIAFIVLKHFHPALKQFKYLFHTGAFASASFFHISTNGAERGRGRLGPSCANRRRLKIPTHDGKKFACIHPTTKLIANAFMLLWCVYQQPSSFFIRPRTKQQIPRRRCRPFINSLTTKRF